MPHIIKPGKPKHDRAIGLELQCDARGCTWRILRGDRFSYHAATEPRAPDRVEMDCPTCGERCAVGVPGTIG